MIDSGAQINLIAQKFVTEWELQPSRAVLPQAQFLSGQGIYCYGAYQLDYWLVDSWGQGRKHSTLFYAIDQEGVNLILGRPALQSLRIIIDAEAAEWRYKLNASKLQVERPTEFAKIIDQAQ